MSFFRFRPRQIWDILFSSSKTTVYTNIADTLTHATYTLYKKKNAYRIIIIIKQECILDYRPKCGGFITKEAEYLNFVTHK